MPYTEDHIVVSASPCSALVLQQLSVMKSLGYDYSLGPKAPIREPGGSLSVTHEIRMLGFEKQGRGR